MATILCDNLWLCQDCTIASCNGDYSGMDDETEKRVNAGLESIEGYLTPNFDSNTDDGIEEFSRKQCDCCGTHLAGYRARFATLK